MTQNARAFEVKMNKIGNKVVIKDLYFDKVISTSYRYEYNDASDVATAYLNNLGIEIIYKCNCNNKTLLISDNFKIKL